MSAEIVRDDSPGPSLDESLDEDQTLRLAAVLILAPPHPAVSDVGGNRARWLPRFFEAQPLVMDEAPDRPKIDLEAAPGEFDDKSQRPNHARARSLAFMRFSNQAPCPPEMAFDLCPPICPGATLPVSRPLRARQSPCANAYAELRRALMTRQGPISTAATARSRKSIEYWFARPCRPPQHVEAEQA